MSHFRALGKLSDDHVNFYYVIDLQMRLNNVIYLIDGVCNSYFGVNESRKHLNNRFVLFINFELHKCTATARLCAGAITSLFCLT